MILLTISYDMFLHLHSSYTHHPVFLLVPLTQLNTFFFHEGECERKKRLPCADVADPYCCQRGAGCYAASNVCLGLIGCGKENFQIE